MDLFERVDAICRTQKTRPAVTLDLPKKAIGYSQDIRGGDRLKVLTGREEAVRAFIVNRLVHELGYRADRLQLEREYSAGRSSSKSKPRADLILEDADGAAFLLMELKDPDRYEADKVDIKGQLFAVAGLHESETGKPVRYLVYYTIEDHDGVLVDKAIIIDRTKYLSYDAWSDDGQPSIGVEIPGSYNRPRRTPLTKEGARDLVHNFSMAEIEGIANNLHNVLWGGGATGDTEVFSSLVNLILAKVQDEYDTQTGEDYKFQVFAHGDDLEAPEEVFKRINQLYRTALQRQLGKEGPAEDQWVVNREKFSLNKVMYTVNQIERFSFIDGKDSLTGRDILGEFFERIQRDGFKQTKGQFFTPPPIVRFMLYALELDTLAVEALNRSTLPYIIDPSCGSATFLIEAMRMVTHELKRRRKGDLLRARAVQQRFDDLLMPDSREHKWARDFIYGVEHNFDLATASKVNMILHGDGSSNIFHQDGLKPFHHYAWPTSAGQRLRHTERSRVYGERDVNAQFDVIISNPPFSVDLDPDTKRSLGGSFIFGQKKNSENLFIERYYQLLREGGRLAAVLPESVFDTTENKYIRLFLFWYFDVIAVVSLPQLAFEPYTQTKTSLLFARKKTEAAVAAWANDWNDAVSAYGKLRTIATNCIEVYINGRSPNRLTSLAGKSEGDLRNAIEAFIGADAAPLEAETLAEFVARRRLLIEEVAEQDSEPGDFFGACNTAWVFDRVARAHDRELFAAEATSVGYKRSKRGVNVQPNQLFETEAAPQVLDVEAVRRDLEDDVGRAKALVAVLSAKAERAKSKARAGPDTLVGPSLPDQRLLRARSALEAAEVVAQRVHAALTRFYEGGVLLDAFRDRTDPELRAVFDLPIMASYRSGDIITSRAQPQTILETMRAAGLWVDP